MKVDEKYNNTISEEDANKLAEIIDQNRTDEDKLVESLPSNNGVEESDGSGTPVTTKETISINSNTGHYAHVEIKPEEDSELEYDPELMKLLSMTEDDIYKVPESVEDIHVNSDMLKQAAVASNISDEDIEIIMPLIKEYMAGKQKDWYDYMPKKVKTMIDMNCAEVHNMGKGAKNLFATELLDTIVREARMDKIAIDMQKAISEAYDISPLMEMVKDRETTMFEDKIFVVINNIKKKLEDEEDEDRKKILQDKIDQLEGIAGSYKEAYTYEKFLAKIKDGKIRIKKKHLDRYKKYCEDFLWKYKKDTPFVIHDVSRITPIIHRKFKDEYSIEQVAAFTVAFCMFTMNMHATDVVDHTYMSYFIDNILNLDISATTSGQSASNIMLLNNIDRVIRALANLPEREYLKFEEETETEEKDKDVKSE